MDQRENDKELDGDSHQQIGEARDDEDAAETDAC